MTALSRKTCGKSHEETIKQAFLTLISKQLSLPADELCRSIFFIVQPPTPDPGLVDHRHEGSYLIFMLEGCQKVIYSDRGVRREHVQFPGEVLYLPSTTTYTVCNDMQYRRLGIGAYKQCYRISYDCHMSSEKYPLPDLWHNKTASDDQLFFRLFAALDDRARAGKASDPVNCQLPRLLLLSLLEILSRKSSPSGDPLPLEHFKRLCAYIGANLSGELARKTLASRFSLSESYISRIFARYAGKGLSGYVLDKRMELARAMLDKGASVTETASACGFRSPGYFSRVRRRYDGGRGI